VNRLFHGDSLFFLMTVHSSWAYLEYMDEAKFKQPTRGETMKAILVHQFGGPEVLKLEHVSRPEPKAREVLVRIRAASINPVDLQTRAGFGMAEQIRSFPVVLGWDLSGEIEAIGAGVMRFKIGDQVYGMPRFPELASTYAEYAVAPEQDLAFKPRNLTHREAAAMPLAALTAHQALEAMKLQAGQTAILRCNSHGLEEQASSVWTRITTAN
jgi:NADPH:quinone reductase-like Zn-dependent oxidoreductase